MPREKDSWAESLARFAGPALTVAAGTAVLYGLGYLYYLAFQLSLGVSSHAILLGHESYILKGAQFGLLFLVAPVIYYAPRVLGYWRRFVRRPGSEGPRPSDRPPHAALIDLPFYVVLLLAAGGWFSWRGSLFRGVVHPLDVVILLTLCYAFLSLVVWNREGSSLLRALVLPGDLKEDAKALGAVLLALATLSAVSGNAMSLKLDEQPRVQFDFRDDQGGESVLLGNKSLILVARGSGYYYVMEDAGPGDRAAAARPVYAVREDALDLVEFRATPGDALSRILVLYLPLPVGAPGGG